MCPVSGPAAVILAAGASTRLGRPKQTIVIGGETLVERAVRCALSAGLDPVIAVVTDADLMQPLQALGAVVLLNRQAYKGIASSIVTGIQWASDVGSTGAVITTCDQVAVTPEHLRSLCEQPDTVTGSVYAGQTGVPAYFPASAFRDLLVLRGDTGARKLLQGARGIPTEVLALDVDTEADVERARRFVEERQ